MQPSSFPIDDYASGVFDYRWPTAPHDDVQLGRCTYLLLWIGSWRDQSPGPGEKLLEFFSTMP